MKKKINICTAFIMAFVLFFTGSSYSLTAFATGTAEEEGEATEAASQESQKATEDAATAQKKAAEEARKKEVADKTAKLQADINSINSEIEKEKAKQAEIKNQISSAKAEVGEKQANVNYIDGQISSTQNEIYLLETKIDLLKQDIDNKIEDIDYKIAEYDENYETFRERIRAMYMYDSSTNLGLIFGSDNYVDFLTTTDNLNRIAQHDEILMEELEEERVALEEEKKKLEGTKKDLEVSAVEAESKRQDLSSQRGAAQAQVYEATDLQAQFESDLNNSVAKSAQMQAEINNIYSQIQSLLVVEEYVGGEMAWPVPGYSQVTSEFGWRFGGKDYHTGMDISGGGVHGAPVVASNGGTVILTNYAYTAGSGYGIFVIVDHGGGRTTLYAHLSAITVSKGDVVARGETIGNVGNTGWSTGPHLHFEVREGESAKNPRNYV